MTVTDLLRRMDSAELTEWMAFYSVEPFGDARGDIQAAIVAATMANCWRGKDKTPYKLSEFLPKFDPPKQQTADDMKKILGAAFGDSPDHNS